MEHLLQDGPQSARAQLLLERGVGDLQQSVAGEVELDLVERAEPLVFGHHGLARLGQDGHQIIRAQRFELHTDRQPPHQLRQESVFHEVLAADLALGRRFLAEESDRLAVAGHFHVGERSGADEQNVRDVDLYVVVLVPMGRDVQRHEDLLPFQDLEQGLLHAFAADVTRARSGTGSAGAPGDLVDLVNEHHAVFGGVHVLICGVQQASDRHLHILAVVASLGERRGVVVCERNIENAGQGARQIRLP